MAFYGIASALGTEDAVTAAACFTLLEALIRSPLRRSTMEHPTAGQRSLHGCAGTFTGIFLGVSMIYLINEFIREAVAVWA